MRISDWSSDVCSSDLEVHRDRQASERVVEADLALHADLVRRYAPLEEVGQLLHVLQLHERERVARVEVFRHAQLRHALVGAVLQVFAHVPDRQPGDAARQGVLRERDLALHRLGHHRSEEPTSELQSLMRISYAVFCLKKKTTTYANKI